MALNDVVVVEDNVNNPSEYKIRMTSRSKKFDEIKFRGISSWKNAERFYKAIKEIQKLSMNINLLKSKTFNIEDKKTTMSEVSSLNRVKTDGIFTTIVEKPKFFTNPLFNKAVQMIKDVKKYRILQYEITSNTSTDLFDTSNDIKKTFEKFIGKVQIKDLLNIDCKC